MPSSPLPSLTFKNKGQVSPIYPLLILTFLFKIKGCCSCSWSTQLLLKINKALSIAWRMTGCSGYAALLSKSSGTAFLCCIIHTVHGLELPTRFIFLSDGNVSPYGVPVTIWTFLIGSLSPMPSCKMGLLP